MKPSLWTRLKRKLFLYGVTLFLLVAPQFALAASGSVLVGSVDWLKPSGGPYPMLKPNEAVWIKVSLDDQKVHIMSGPQIVYTMIASKGLDTPADDRTPQGAFFVQRERETSFYSAKLGEGARYWVSWLHHGEYLFHSLPTDSRGQIIAWEARKLGQKASHGCIRLTLPDARWLYENIRYGTKVVIGP
ncbi:MAG: L,D-transpeptidase [Rectinemataceae bacterium]